MTYLQLTQHVEVDALGNERCTVTAGFFPEEILFSRWNIGVEDGRAIRISLLVEVDVADGWAMYEYHSGDRIDDYIDSLSMKRTQFTPRQP